MNVLIATIKYPPDFSGAGPRIHRIYKSLKTKGVTSVSVITTTEVPGRVFAVVDGNAVHYVSTVPLRRPSHSRIGKFVSVFFGSLRVWITFWKMRHKIDIVHSVGTGWLSLAVDWAAYTFRKPLLKELVGWGEDPISLSKRKFPPVQYYSLKPFEFAEKIVVISHPLKDLCLQYGIHPDRIWYRANPVYLAPCTETHTQVLEIAGIDPDIPMILWVGVIIERKNIHFLLRAGFHLTGPLQLIFVGPSGDDLYFMKALSLSKQIEHSTLGSVKTYLIGRVDDRRVLSALFQKAALFWFASKDEGMGNVVGESLMCGTPVITLPVKGIMKHLIVQGEDGEVVDTDDPIHFASVVNRWIGKRIDRSAIINRAREKFAPEPIEAEYLTILKDLCKKNHAPH